MISLVQSPITRQKFVILDEPNDRTLKKYIDTLAKENVTILVRFRSWNQLNDHSAGELEKQTGIQVIDHPMIESDSVPNREAIRRWLELTETARRSKATIGVHSMAGICRAPLLIALSLIETGMRPIDAISYVREHRRGVLTKSELRFLMGYRRTSRHSRWFGWLKRRTMSVSRTSKIH
ncbi:Protein tyrosine phosphatase type IVA 1 [Apophysomyces ossiformis]|uniref:Protein tyrosine phosphatase type IVA 1 n=1 Tax=Apophysomyces ossiformis TaxID=679940 RepID=A0A8H7BR16_9FUNG|nr:Protein tyrosine phosphatase type IVA 1 [Apophysomyces ossiformis]